MYEKLELLTAFIEEQSYMHTFTNTSGLIESAKLIHSVIFGSS